MYLSGSLFFGLKILNDKVRLRWMYFKVPFITKFLPTKSSTLERDLVLTTKKKKMNEACHHEVFFLINFVNQTKYTGPKC